LGVEYRFLIIIAHSSQ